MERFSTRAWWFMAPAVALACGPLFADVSLNNMFGDHMVLQQGIRNRVWGKADPGESVAVTLSGQARELGGQARESGGQARESGGQARESGGQARATVAGPDGTWEVFLDPVREYGGPHTLSVKGKNELKFEDVLIGEVWVCAGQSNMQWSVGQCKDPDLERAAANFPNIRLVSVPQVGTQKPQWNFNGRWTVCSPETVGTFSAVGYYFGRQVHQTLGVPVGLINNAWSGSAAEAWVNREKLAANPRFRPLHEQWVRMESAATPEELQMRGNLRPGNIHAGVLSPSIGYGIRGAIWYQGESNAGRACQYRELFPFLIKSWREEWGLGDFPFYWVQLADFGEERPEPAESEWAELREAQTMTMKALPATGEAVIIDIGEGKDIHPMNKQDVAKRLARWALAETYGRKDIVCRSPRYKSMEKQGQAIVLSFDHVAAAANAWRPFDVASPIGFTIAGADRKFVPAQARILADGRIAVASPAVADPVAARYAWADNPVCNMYSAAGLPLTPFRTDDFPGITAGRD